MINKYYIFGVVTIFVVLSWLLTTPPSYNEVSKARLVEEMPMELKNADIGDLISTDIVDLGKEIPGHDEIIGIPGTNKVLVSARDEWIWLVDLDTNTAEKFAESPVSPTGATLVPGKKDQLYFCMARLDYNKYQKNPGLYVLDLNSKKFEEIVTRVPITGNMREDGLEIPNQKSEDQVVVYSNPLKNTKVSDLYGEGSRPLQFCNDLAVSKDGRHVYITEPFSHPKASSGLGAFAEGITLAHNGRVWRYDTEKKTIGLVIENIVFADGILIEYNKNGEEESLLISETVNFRMGRASLFGPNQGKYTVLWDNLPGLPDGLDRDKDGRVLVALIKDRTGLMNWLHRNPWIKPLILRIPPTWLPKSKGTGILVLSPDASEVIAYSHHNGTKILDVSVVAPVGDKFFLPSFYKDNTGIHYIPMNSLLLKSKDKILSRDK
ncbi:SMP-30/gluconolaconase/LRE-like region [Leptospira mtsangambouensis]|uniref:SMP-30/gluconolaconase/LRE-like region n=1 Tax=Leptospira mtsangambouensis TaxID=2484912 RepID=A0ABY2NZG1_9LEPT|nr:SMP-30/gluconolactonase/LRE family protein [Leptospira mtsangambouensis]TGM74465.1 SMP-30/gluconolaconase/LRE-like region [Leptospira mtsangambouensis]